jgi:hypothetical protein
MPNYCNNTLQLESGKPIREFLQPYIIKSKDGDYEFDFNKIIPIPEDLKCAASFGTKDSDEQKLYEQNINKHGYAHWYDFCVAKWGTKWTGQGDFNYDDTCLSFETAWSPPIPVIEELAKKLPDDETLILNYIEEGEDYCGKYIAGNQGGVDESYSPIKDAPQCLLDELGWEPWEEEEECEEEVAV